MNCIIFGCGITGQEALQRIGEHNVQSFASNHPHKEPVCGKRVLSFSEMAEAYAQDPKLTVVIASEYYWRELEAQVREANIQRYFVYQSYLGPSYQRNREVVFPLCSQILADYHISEYTKIAIYGQGISLPLLVSEIRWSSPAAEIFLLRPDYAAAQAGLSLPCISLEEAEQTIDCLIVNIPRHEDPAAIRDRVEGAPFTVADLYAAELFDPAFHYEGMERFKGIHAGKRVFVIGNGPSLTVRDLNTLHEHGEICIAFNKVYRVYDRTPWRADYLGFSDMYAIEDCEADIPSLPGQLILADSFHFYPNKCFSNVQYYHMNAEKFYPNYPGFSDNASKVMYNGWTVTYDIGLQLAAYMGFHEIYLLGVDHSMNGNAGRPENHFIADYTRPEEAEKYQNVYFEAEKMIRAYEKAELYSRTHGFRIFNATRGGKLEVFERVDFDSLFGK